MDLGDLYAYDNPNLYSCIMYAYLHVKNKLACGPMLNSFKPYKILPKDLDFEKLRPNFAWIPAKTVKETIENSTQWYQAENRCSIRHHVKFKFPAANVNHIPDTVSYDIIFSDTSVADDGILGHAGCTML